VTPEQLFRFAVAAESSGSVGQFLLLFEGKSLKTVCTGLFALKQALKQPRKHSGLFKGFLARNELAAYLKL
jgi:hypothetical protein